MIALCQGAPAADAPPAAPPFRTAHNATLKAEERELESNRDFAKLRVEFNGIEGDRVPGHLYLPKAAGAARRRPAILVQHGIGDRKQAEYVVECCKLIAARGMIALAIDAPHRGERKVPGAKSPEIWNLTEVRAWFRQHCGDYSRALDYLATRPDVDGSQLGYIGFSWGAITGITFAAHDPRVRCVGSVVGGGNLLGALGPELDPARTVGRIAPRPLLFLNATKDQVVLRPFAESLHKAAGKGAVVRWHETDHIFRGTDRPRIMGELADFMKAHIAPLPLIAPPAPRAP